MTTTSASGISFVDLAAQRARLGDAIDERLRAVLEHGRFIMGPEVAELEDRLCDLTRARHAISCASGTDALVMALLALGVGPGDAVLVPTFTFAATAEAVALIGASPVFVDVEAHTFTVDPAGLDAGLDAARRAGLRPVGVIVVDLFGHPADSATVASWSSHQGLWLVADGAQALGSARRGRPCGTLATITTTSFFPAKPLGCYGDGGALFTDDSAIAERLRSIRVHGQGADKYENVRIGVNGRLDTMQAAVLLAKLDAFPDELDARRAIARRYHEGLRDVVIVPEVHPDVVPAWAQYTIRTSDRDRVADDLRASGIPTAVYYPRPLHRQMAYLGFPRAGELAVADALCDEVLSIPVHPYLDAEAQERIIDAVRLARG